MKVTIETPRLLLRPWNIEDAEAMFSTWANDPEVTKFLTWNAHESVEITKMIVSTWVEQYQEKERINFAIVLKQTNALIGGIDVVKYIDGVPVIGYVSGKAYWGNGYMTEACKCVLKFLKEQGFRQARIDACVDNIGSNRVIQKCGGVLERTEQNDRPLRNDTVMVNRYIIDI